MIVAGWAWDPSPLAEQVSRSAQGNLVLVLFAVGIFGLLFAGLAAIETCWTKRRWRRDIARTHQPRPFDYERDAA